MINKAFARARNARANLSSPSIVTRALAGLPLIAAVVAFSVAGGATSASARSARASMIPSADCKRNAAVGTINFVSPFSYDASAGIMDVYMAQKLGYFKDLCLKVAMNASSYTGEELVSSDRAQVTGIGSAADAILTAATGANVTGVATYGQTDPHVILTNSKITSLKQLEGGTLGYYTNITPGALQMLTNAGVDISKIKFIKLTTYSPTIVTSGQIDGLIGYASNQGSAFKDLGKPYHAFYPSQYGVKGTYNVMQFNTTWLTKHTAVAADFMRADLKAVDYCIANKVACASYMATLAAQNHQGAAFPKSLEIQIWDIESKFITSAPKPWGVETIAEWEPALALVKKWGKEAGMTAGEKIPPLSKIENTTLVKGLYKGNTLIWPGT